MRYPSARPNIVTRPRLRCGAVELDPASGLAWSGGLPVRLTRKEAALLAAFLAAPGRLYTRAALLALVWQAPPSAALRTRTVDVHILHLRQKLGPHQRIVTVFKRGYYWAG